MNRDPRLLAWAIVSGALLCGLVGCATLPCDDADRAANQEDAVLERWNER